MIWLQVQSMKIADSLDFCHFVADIKSKLGLLTTNNHHLWTVSVSVSVLTLPFHRVFVHKGYIHLQILNIHYICYCWTIYRYKVEFLTSGFRFLLHFCYLIEKRYKVIRSLNLCSSLPKQSEALLSWRQNDVLFWLVQKVG